MELGVRLPYRRVTLRLVVESYPDQRNKVNLERAVLRQEKPGRVEKSVDEHRVSFEQFKAPVL